MYSLWRLGGGGGKPTPADGGDNPERSPSFRGAGFWNEKESTVFYNKNDYRIEQLPFWIKSLT